MEFITLNNGVKMPMLGYGVLQILAGDTERCVLDAISVGYRSIDTAQGKITCLPMKSWQRSGRNTARRLHRGTCGF